MSQKALPSGGGEAGSEATSLCEDGKSSLCAAMQLLSRGLSPQGLEAPVIPGHLIGKEAEDRTKPNLGEPRFPH